MAVTLPYYCSGGCACVMPKGGFTVRRDGVDLKSSMCEKCRSWDDVTHNREQNAKRRAGERKRKRK